MTQGDRSTERISAAAMVRDELRKVIYAGEISPGAQLRQDELAERFGTSRIPVREALRQLQAEGLVSILPNRGATVLDLSLDQVLELLDIRIALECRALRLAIPNMIDADYEVAADILRSYDLEPDPRRWGEMNWAFHEALYAPCGRAKLLAMIGANYGRVGRFIRAWLSRAAGKERPQREHYALLNSCRSNDVDQAVGILENHLMLTQKSLMAAGRRRSTSWLTDDQ